jgi:pyroglutamyl-peptidase
MKTVLVTGFEPFGGETVNPSAEIARRLDGRLVAGRRVAGLVLPCVFTEARERLESELRSRRPILVICFGQAGGREGITPERVALNIDEASIPDNAGRQPADRPIVPGGPAAYWSTLPITDIVAGLRARGLPSSVSNTAGTFVCNHVFYGLMRALRLRRGVRGGFIHVPWLPEQGAAHGGQPSLPLETMVEGALIALEAALAVT